MHAIITKAFIAALIIGTGNAFPTPMGNSPNDNTDLIAQLITAPTQIKRFQKLLTDESGKLLQGDRLTNATIYDFEQNVEPVPGGQDGSLLNSADIESFPILINSGIKMTLGKLGPCGIFLPHVHPRANEFFVVVDGEVDFGTLLEFGLLFEDLSPNPEIGGKLTKDKGTLFPQGSVHYQVNNSPDCKPATIYAAFSNEDAGTTPILMDPLPGNVTVGMRKRVDATDFESVRAITPLHIAKVVDECLARCHLS